MIFTALGTSGWFSQSAPLQLTPPAESTERTRDPENPMKNPLTLSLVTTIALASCQAAPAGVPLPPLSEPSPVRTAEPVDSALPEALTLESRPTFRAIPAVSMQEEEGFNSEFEKRDEDEWRFVIAPYAWLLQLDGNTEVDGTVSRIDESFSDLFDQLSFMVEARFEAWKGDWGALVDVTYAKLENDADIGPLEADIDTDVLIALAGVLRNFIRRAPDENGVGGLTVNGFLGVAVTAIDVDVDVSGGPSASDDETWVDPVIGMRSRFTFSEKWGGSLEYVFGGFEAFGGSELTTIATALVGRRFGNDKILYFGWRSMFIDYSQDFDLDLAINGPLVGFEWGF
jgi:hypothetical protein